MRHWKKQSYILMTTVLILGVFSLLGSANATRWFLGTDGQLDVDVTLTYGASMKVTEMDDLPDPVTEAEAYTAAINRDDGKQNFDQWDLVNNKLTALADVELQWKNFGVFVRPKAFYDLVYMTNNSNDSPETNNAYQGGLIDSSHNWDDEIKDIHGNNAEILDLFAYTNFRLGEIPFDVRVGKQVISWGESTFIPGISMAQSPIDISTAQNVGTEVKEIYMPTGAVLVQTGFGDLGLRAYYQWEWKKSRLMEAGTFFSQFDATDEIKAGFLAGAGDADAPTAVTVPRVEDDEARDDGQYGVAVAYMLPWAATEIAGYFINYHDKSFTLNFGNGGYYLAFQEDIKLYGFSVSSCIGDTQVYAEFSYRDNFMFQNSANPPDHGEGDYYQSQAGFTHVLSPAPFGISDRTTLIGEAAYAWQTSLESTPIGKNEAGFMVVGQIMNEWFQVFRRTDFGLDLSFSDCPLGTIDQFGFFQHTSAFAVAAHLTFNDVWECGLTYENRFNTNFLADSDTLSLKLQYSF